MPDLEPITREEMLWSGEDIEPITREEMYIKHIFDKTQTIPSKPITRKEMLLEKAGEGGGSDVTIKQLSVTENGTYSEENTAYSPVIVNVPAPPIPDNAYLLKEVDGLPKDIATFSDGSNLPMPSLKVSIEPVQDLHGYDAPWVGGAGKNKANIADMNVQSQTTMGRITLPSGTYVASATVKNNTTIGGAIKINTLSENVATGAIPSASGTSRVATNSFTLSEPTEIVVVVSGTISGYNYDVSQVQIEQGSTATTFAPYSNICPISGFTEGNVSVWGKNLCGELEIGTFAESSPIGSTYDDMKTANGARIRSKGLIPTFNNNIVISCDFANYQYCFCLYDANKKYLGQTDGFGSWKNIAYTPVTPSSYVAIVLKRNDGELITSADLENCHLQVELGNTATTYEPYNGHTTTIPFRDGDNPLTVYGGSLDVTSGELVVDWAMLDLGNLNYTKNATFPNIFNTTLAINAKTTLDAICEIYTLYGSENLSQYDYGFAISAGLSVMYIKNKDYAEIDDFKTAMNGVKVVYKLATPITIQLTPTSIKSIEGVNNVWADTGDIEELEYFSKEV